MITFIVDPVINAVFKLNHTFFYKINILDQFSDIFAAPSHNGLLQYLLMQHLMNFYNSENAGIEMSEYCYTF